MCAAEHEELSLILRTHKVKKKANFHLLGSDFHMYAVVCTHVNTHARTHTHTIKI